ncbi:hypothetical protein FEM03_21330 [Phragmitibacter flavus]|uniref:PEP-CTERM sorting domain-containing protein n=1 Tax=Phragmitibacter flavus TaxID=2576071 RepID=A0A5R8K8T9_9BACT|nr:autotransporter-associated beta strand repeat-containing protein [Phragmitibacter flavus]TLD68726.1 hypothetical protein FEM03_21330 [Phragmitibacter flavus]
MTPLNPLQTLRRSFLSLLFAATLTQTVSAQALWNGNGAADNWNDSANWISGATTPFDISAGSFALQFSNTGAATLTNDFAAGYAVNSITFLAGASAFTLTGDNSITLNTNGAIANSSANNQRIEFDINTLTGGNRAVSSAGSTTLTFTGDITGSGTFYVTGGNVTMEGVVSAYVYRTNGGTLTLSNPNNSFAGEARAAAGVLSVNNIANSGVNSAIGRGTTITLGQSYAQSVSVATLRLTNDYAILGGSYGTAGSGTTNRTINIANGTSSVGGSNLAGMGNYGGGILENAVAGETATFNGNITTSSRDRFSSLGLQGIGNGIVNGAITNQAKMTVTKAGTGTWTINGANTHAGQTIVNGGTLIIGNSQALGSTGFTTNGTNGGTTVTTGTLDLNGQTNVNEVFTLNGTGNGGVGALTNNSATEASIGNGIASITVTSSSANVGGTTPTVTISGGGGTGASAVATLGVTAASFTVTDGGSNQTGTGSNTYSTPNITAGGGQGASAKVTVAGGVVTGVEILSMGSGFTSAPSISFAVPGSGNVNGVVNPTFTTNNNNFAAEVAVTNAGSGYTSAPTVTLSGPGTNTAVANLSSVNLASASSIGGSGDLTIDAVVSSTNDTSHLTKIGTGKLTLNAANTYTSNTALNGGTLLANNTTGSATGSGSLTSLTGSNATLGGNGTLLGGAGKNITINQGTNLMVGSTHGLNAGGPQILTIGDALAPTALDVSLFGTLQFDLFGNDGSSTSLAENDRLRVYSNTGVDLTNSILQVSATGLTTTTWAINDTWKLIDWTGAPTSTGTPTINPALLPTLAPNLVWNSYTTSDGLYLTIADAIPEPSRMLLLIGALGALLIQRRR